MFDWLEARDWGPGPDSSALGTHQFVSSFDRFR